MKLVISLHKIHYTSHVILTGTNYSLNKFFSLFEEWLLDFENKVFRMYIKLQTYIILH